MTVHVGDTLTLDPVTGSVTLPSGFVDALRDAGAVDIEGDGEAFILVAETDDASFGWLSFEATQVPDAGPMTVQIEGSSEPIQATEPGTQSLVLINFSLIVGPPVEEEEDLTALFCDLDDEGDAAIDSFEVVSPATPTKTVTTTATATPTTTGPVVETDRPATGSVGPLLAAAGAAAMLAGMGALLLNRRQGDHR
jgi:hypothetical protein